MHTMFTTRELRADLGCGGMLMSKSESSLRSCHSFISYIGKLPSGERLYEALVNYRKVAGRFRASCWQQRIILTTGIASPNPKSKRHPIRPSIARVSLRSESEVVQVVKSWNAVGGIAVKGAGPLSLQPCAAGDSSERVGRPMPFGGGPHPLSKHEHQPV